MLKIFLVEVFLNLADSQYSALPAVRLEHSESWETVDMQSLNNTNVTREQMPMFVQFESMCGLAEKKSRMHDH